MKFFIWRRETGRRSALKPGWKSVCVGSGGTRVESDDQTSHVVCKLQIVDLFRRATKFGRRRFSLTLFEVELPDLDARDRVVRTRVERDAERFDRVFVVAQRRVRATKFDTRVPEFRVARIRVR